MRMAEKFPVVHAHEAAFDLDTASWNDLTVNVTHDSWGRSVRNYYQDPNEGGSDDTMDPEDLDVALEEAIAIRKAQMDSIAADDLGLGDLICIPNSTSSSMVEEKNDGHEALNMLLTNLAEHHPKKPDINYSDLTENLFAACKELLDRVMKESIPALHFLHCKTASRLKLSDECIDFLSCQLQIFLWVASVVNGISALGCDKFLHHLPLVHKALKKYWKIRKHLCDPILWEGLQGELRAVTNMVQDDYDSNNKWKHECNMPIDVLKKNHGDASSAKNDNSNINTTLDCDDMLDNTDNTPDVTSAITNSHLSRMELRKKKFVKELPSVPKGMDNESDARKINREVEKNRGLTRIRKKYSGHARVANKMKYKKKLTHLNTKRLRGEELTSSGDYRGETLGISAHVVRSKRLRTV